MRNYRNKNCTICDTSFQPTSGGQWRCPSCAAKKLRPGPIPLCGCGCGEEVKWKQGKWNKYLSGHYTRLENPRKKGSIPWNKGNKILHDKVCKQCEKHFKTRDKRAKFCSHPCYHKWNTGENNVLWKGGTQIKCSPKVIAQKRGSERKKRETSPPLCSCGCGTPTKWSRKNSGWSKYIQGHHIRKNNPNKDGHAAWNKGKRKREKRSCITCHKQFQPREDNHKYCSNECYAKTLKGERSNFWTGGIRTKYKHVWIDGRSIREHRYLMSKYLKRELNRSESVHHIDGEGTHNVLNNLHLFHCEKCHQFFHCNNVPLLYKYPKAHKK